MNKEVSKKLIKVHTIEGYIQNIHLAEYEHGLLLLDGCCKVDYASVEKYIVEVLQRPLCDLHSIVVTHMHPDHAGCASTFRKRLNCKILTGQNTRQWYAGIRGRLAHIVDIGLALWVAGRMGKPKKNIWYSPTLCPCIELDDGQAIPNFEDWRVIYTPGHTDRDISLVNEVEKIVYVADLIVSIKKQLSPPFPIYLPQQYKHSLERLKSYCGFELLMAHVAPIRITENDIDSLILRAPSHPKTSYLSVKNKLKRITR